MTRSEVHFFAHKNNIYFIAVDGYDGARRSFALGWDLSVVQPAPAQASISKFCAREKTGVGGKPDCDPVAHPEDAAVLCTADSANVPLCQQFFDLNGFRLLTVKGENFTSDTQVIIKGKLLTGFTLDGTAINGQTTFINSQTLVAHIPPLPQLAVEDLLPTQVTTKLPSTAAFQPDSESTSPGELPPGTYSLGQNVGLTNVILLKNATIPAGQSGKVCGYVSGLNKIGEETCITMQNAGTGPARLTRRGSQLMPIVRPPRPVWTPRSNARDTGPVQRD